MYVLGSADNEQGIYKDPCQEIMGYEKDVHGIGDQIGVVEPWSVTLVVETCNFAILHMTLVLLCTKHGTTLIGDMHRMHIESS